MSSNVWFCSLKSRKIGTGKRVIEASSGKDTEGVAKRFAPLYGNGSSRTLSTALQIAVVAPMPKASVRMAITAKPAFFPSMRRP
jgi:hypothetical protein